jgi:hypothetical protein
LKSFEMICIPGIFLGSYQPLNLDLWSCPKSEKPRILSETPRTSTEACPENHWAVHGMVQKSNSFIWGLGINFRVFRHFSAKQREARFWNLAAIAEPQIVLFLDLFSQVWSFPGSTLILIGGTQRLDWHVFWGDDPRWTNCEKII